MKNGTRWHMNCMCHFETVSKWWTWQTFSILMGMIDWLVDVDFTLPQTVYQCVCTQGYLDHSILQYLLKIYQPVEM